MFGLRRQAFTGARVASRQAIAVRSYSTPNPGQGGANVHGNNPETIEQEKAKSQKGEKSEKLKSDSEAAVKHEDHSKSPEELQKETEQHHAKKN